jgi:hypothetical protein
MNRTDRCPGCSGGGLVPALECTCDGKAHTCTPAICTVCMGSGVPVASDRRGNRRSITVTRRHALPAPTSRLASVDGWPDFGLTVMPNADNCCALLSNVLAGQKPNWLVRRTRVDLYGSDGLSASPRQLRSVP